MHVSGFSQTETGLVPVPQQGLGNVVKDHKKPPMLLVLNCALGPLQELGTSCEVLFLFFLFSSFSVNTLKSNLKAKKF